MKPRQNLKNLHSHTSTNAPPPPSFSPFHQNSTLTPTAPQNLQTPPQPLPLPPSLRDIDLAKLGINLDDMSNLLQAANNNPTLSSQEEIIKCLQAIYGKNSADILQKLPPLNDWPMQSVSPSDFPRVVGGGGSGAGCSSNSVITSCGSSIIGNAGGSGGAASFTNNDIKNGNPSQQRQDMHFANAQHQATAPATINHNQFRVPTTNTHLPQQHQQQLSQHKSVLSLHQHHPNDSTNRRLSHQQNLGTTSNTSFVNLNAPSLAATSSMSSNTDSINSPSTLGSSIAANINNSNRNPLSGPYINNNSASSSHLPSIMDTLGSSIDNMLYDNSLKQGASPMNKEGSANQQQSLTKHQQLQRLLKATNSQPKSPSSSSTSSSNFSHRNDSHIHRNINSSMSQMQRQLTSPVTSISPPQPATLSAVPKSLLNLAACSSSPPSSSSGSALNYGSKISNLSQFNLTSSSSRQSSNNGPGIASNNRSSARTSSNINDGSYSQQKVSVPLEPSTLLQQISKNTTLPATSDNSNSSNFASNSLQTSFRPNPRQQHNQSTLLPQDDQAPSSRNNLKSSSSNSGGSSRAAIIQQALRQSLQHSSADEVIGNQQSFLASLQERAAKVGVSIGEIPLEIASCSTSATVSGGNQNLPCISTTNLPPACQSVNSLNLPSKQSKDDIIEPYDRREIESALSRVEARNDLSLLYPPMLLAPNSQRQINALSAGLHESEDSELFTNEVRKIVLEECNIIYECKECNNLFRSLANLVKHKRTYCVNQSSNRNQLDLSRRTNSTIPSPLIEQSVTVQGNAIRSSTSENSRDLQDNMTVEGHRQLEDFTSNCSSLGQQKYNLRGRVSSVEAQAKVTRNQDKGQLKDRDTVAIRGTPGRSIMSGSAQTSLSRLLQSQPKNRLPVNRDSALMGALNMTSISLSSDRPGANVPRSLDSENKNVNDINEQLVRNSSLAKTLLDERVKSYDTQSSNVTTFGQSLLDNNSMHLQSSVPTTKKQPKRKFLEDCIQRVKRDKIRSDDDQDLPSSFSNYSQEIGAPNNSLDESRSKFIKDPLSIDDSDADSDLLMIDLDGPNIANDQSNNSITGTRSLLSKKGNRRSSTTASSTASSSSSTRLNTSSALLKALTRPVDAKPSYTSVNNSCTNEEKSANVLNTATQDEPMDQMEDDAKQQEALIEKEDQHDQSDELIEVLSPLFDNYRCDICEDDYQDQETLMNHIIEKHQEEKMIYPCIFCSFSFISLENVCRHIIDIHKKPKAQVHRLKDVVRSRSYVSNDLSGCSDHPATLSNLIKPSSNEEHGGDERIKVDTEEDKARVSTQSTQMSPRQRNQDPGDIVLQHAHSEASSMHSASSSRIGPLSSPRSSSLSPNQQILKQDDVIIAEIDVDREGAQHSDVQQMDTNVDESQVSVGNESEDHEFGIASTDDDALGLDGQVDDDHGLDSNENAGQISVIDKDPIQATGSSISPDKVVSAQLSGMTIPNKGKQIKMSQRTSIDQENEIDHRVEDVSEANTEDDCEDEEEEDAGDAEDDEDEDGDDEVDEDQEGGDEDEAEDDDNDNEDEDEDYDEDDGQAGGSQAVESVERTPTKSHIGDGKSSLQTTPSSSSAGSGGGSGIMKLKIQLKTQPDEKSKVYRIV